MGYWEKVFGQTSLITPTFPQIVELDIHLVSSSLPAQTAEQARNEYHHSIPRFPSNPDEPLPTFHILDTPSRTRLSTATLHFPTDLDTFCSVGIWFVRSGSMLKL